MLSARRYQSSEKKLDWLFSTPLLSVVWHHVEDLNRRIASLILAAEREAASVKRSNVGGWQSERGLQEWKDPAIGTLLDMLDIGIREMANAMIGDGVVRRSLYDWSIIAWANVNRTSQFNAVHNHEGFWSGVYYVAVDPKPADPSEGAIQFRNPSSAPQISQLTPAPDIFRNRFPFEVQINPECGQMLLFPSWLEHWVRPHFSIEPRISVGFNVVFPRQDNGETYVA
jgi:uncharacterized protein (TIGR02466 family)